MIYKPKHFQIYELLPKAFLEANAGQGDLLWLMFDRRVLWTADRLRERYGPMIANTWYWPDKWDLWGRHEFRGWRPMDCRVGALLSQHKFGRALDLVPLETDAYRIREEIVTERDNPVFQYVTCLEDNIPWLHFDTRNWTSGILIVNP
jgi:hypothetical protein